jgi:hypothetical protein
VRVFRIRVERGSIVDIHGFDSSRESVSLAVASMSGITFGAAHRVLRLLLPEEIAGRALSEAPSADLLRTDLVDGKTRFAISLVGGSAAEISVDSDFVLWRVGSIGRRVRRRESTAERRESRYTRALVYQPELYTKEVPELTLDG